MKKLINKTIILSLFVALTGCNDWLDVSPKADMKAEDLFGTEAGFRDALVGVYALMCGTNSYGRDLTYGYLDVLAQYYKQSVEKQLLPVMSIISKMQQNISIPRKQRKVALALFGVIIFLL